MVLGLKMNNQLDDKTILELSEYAELAGSEWGETANALLSLHQMRTLLSDNMIKALEYEIVAWLDNVKESAEIIEEVVTPSSYTVKSLEWY